MKSFGVMLVALFSASSLACDLSSEQNVQVTSKILPAEYGASCSVVEVESVSYSDNNIALDNVRTHVDIYLSSGSLLASTWMDVTIIDGNYLSTGCLPTDSGYRIEITIKYHPEGGISMCPKRIQIRDLDDFLRRQDSEH